MIRIARSLLPLLLIAPLLVGCSTFNSIFGEDDPLEEARKEDRLKNLDPAALPPEDVYNHGVDALQREQYRTAVKQFDAVEQNHPYSSWAVNAQIMQAYALYLKGDYTEALGVIDRFIQLHPTHQDIAYIYYLRALCYYEQIADIQRDQRSTELALAALQDVVNRFPDTAYARDARFKVDLCRDHLAGKEMTVGRWYEQEHLYSAAIGRFQHVVDAYQTTNHVPEALHRLTEIYLILGLRSEARRTASVLGYNYPGNEWYESSYDDLVNSGTVNAADGSAPAAKPEPPGFFGRTFGALF